jgi:glutamate transport system permease protein
MSAQSVLFDAPGPKARRFQRVCNVIGAIVVVGVAAVVILRLVSKGQFAAALWKPVFTNRAWQYYFLPGLQNTVVAAAYSIVTSMVFGLLFGLGRLARNRALRWFCGLIVEFFRAVPVLIMMIATWFLVARVLGPDHASSAPLIAVVIGLTLYNGSVIAELVRSGVHGLPKGQREAGLAIGMTRGQSIRLIELPQALIAMLPSLVSQFVVILKDSALGSLITYTELLRAARLLGSASPFPILQSLFVAAVIFIVLNFALSKAAEFLARRVGGRTAGKARADQAPTAVAVPVIARREPR